MAYPWRWPRVRVFRTSISSVPGKRSVFGFCIPIDSLIIGRTKYWADRRSGENFPTAALRNRRQPPSKYPRLSAASRGEGVKIARSAERLPAKRRPSALQWIGAQKDDK